MYTIHKDMVVILANVLGILIIQERGIGIPKPRAWMAEIIKLDWRSGYCPLKIAIWRLCPQHFQTHNHIKTLHYFQNHKLLSWFIFFCCSRLYRYTTVFTINTLLYKILNNGYDKTCFAAMDLNSSEWNGMK